jgi:replicative DNA helicase
VVAGVRDAVRLRCDAHHAAPAAGSLAPVGLRRATSGRIDDRNPKCCTAVIVAGFVSEFSMIDVVDRILSTYQSMCPLDAERATDSRQKISRYIENLASAGQRDAEQLTIYGLAYLTELHEGHDPRFTGC